jgi:hypothetical protein
MGHFFEKMSKIFSLLKNMAHSANILFDQKFLKMMKATKFHEISKTQKAFSSKRKFQNLGLPKIKLNTSYIQDLFKKKSEIKI